MAKNLRRILGSKLLTTPLASEPLKDLPSPEVQSADPDLLRPSTFFSDFPNPPPPPLLSGSEGSHPDKGEETHPSPGSAGEERQLHQFLLQLRRRSGERRQERAEEGSGQGQRRRRSRRRVRCAFQIRDPVLPSFAGQLQTEPRAVGAGGVLQKRSLPRLRKRVRKPSQ